MCPLGAGSLSRWRSCSGGEATEIKFFSYGFFSPSYGSHFELNLSMYEAFDTENVLQVCFGLLAYREVQGTDLLVSSRSLHGFLCLIFFFLRTVSELFAVGERV